MTKIEAAHSIATLSSGTIARIIRSNRYSDIDAAVNRYIGIIKQMPEDAFSKCASWKDVLKAVFAFRLSISAPFPFAPDAA